MKKLSKNHSNNHAIHRFLFLPLRFLLLVGDQRQNGEEKRHRFPIRWRLGVGLVIGRIHGKRIKFAFYEEQFLVPEEKNREGSSISQTIRAESFTRATPLPPLPPLPLRFGRRFYSFSAAPIQRAKLVNSARRPGGRKKRYRLRGNL